MKAEASVQPAELKQEAVKSKAYWKGVRWATDV